MAETPILYCALCIGLTGRTDEPPPLALRYFLAERNADADVELLAMQRDPNFPLHQHPQVVHVAAVANPVPLPRRLTYEADGEVREYELRLVPVEPPTTRPQFRVV